MGEIGVGEWTIEKERDSSYEVSSPKGTVVANRVENGDSSQTWIVDADVEGIEPMSWQVQVEENTELVNQVIPALLNEQMPEMNISRSN